MAHDCRQVDQDYQYVLMDLTVYVTTAESNYHLVYRRDHHTLKSAIDEYWRIRMDMRKGKGIFEACRIPEEAASEYIRNWERVRTEGKDL